MNFPSFNFKGDGLAILSAAPMIIKSRQNFPDISPLIYKLNENFYEIFVWFVIYLEINIFWSLKKLIMSVYQKQKVSFMLDKKVTNTEDKLQYVIYIKFSKNKLYVTII